jgi:hypothetical protein
MKSTHIILAIAAILAVAGPCLAATKSAPAPSAAAPASPATTPTAAPAANGFAFQDTAGQHLDISFDGRLVARWMYAYDATSSAKIAETYKPFLHVFDAAGKEPITKGAGGFDTHHRGIYDGWQQIGFNGKKYNLWEMPDGVQVQKKFLAQKADADQASFTVLIAWNLNDGTTIIEEERTMTLRRRAAPTLALVDFSTKIKAVKGDLTLAGDPEHGGVQYRAANDVDRAATKYCFPAGGVKPDDAAEWRPGAPQNTGAKALTISLDIPWAALAYSLKGQNYFVEEMSLPDNPKGTVWSAYRDYARFGPDPKATLKSGETLVLKYRFWVTTGQAPTRADFQREYEAYVKDAKGTAAN